MNGEICFVICDTETTGLSAKKERIVSIAASCEGREFSSLVDPGKPIPIAASKVHGLTDAIVLGAGPWKAVGRALVQWIQGVSQGRSVVLIAHNARFDLGFLAAENARCQLPPFPEEWRVTDTLVVFRKAFPQLKSHKQPCVYKFVTGKEAEGQHSADGDVRVLAELCSHPAIAPLLEGFARPVKSFSAKK